MGKITGSGVPTKETVGYVGDTYEDAITGKEYICTFACVIGDSVDCEWEEVTTNSKTEEPDVKIPPEKTYLIGVKTILHIIKIVNRGSERNGFRKRLCQSEI